MPRPTVTELRIAGSIEPWRAAGFAVDGEGLAHVGAVALRIGGPGHGITGWTLTGLGEADVDGIPTERGPATSPIGDRAPHPNTTVSLDHVVVRTADPSATFAAFEATGMLLRGERLAGSGEELMRQGFFRHGEAVIEVVGPAAPAGHQPSALWGLTVTVSDIEVCAAVMGERLGTIRPAVQPGRRIATVRREAGLGVPLAVMTR